MGPGTGHLSGVGAVTFDPQPCVLLQPYPVQLVLAPRQQASLAGSALDLPVASAPLWPAAHTPLGSHALALAVLVW